MSKYYQNENIMLFHDDCINILPEFSDKHFDLCLTDPQYGICGKKVSGFMKENFAKLGESQEWDKERLDKIYFDEMKRVSKNQIIWGFNYYADILGNTKEPLVWDKLTGKNYFADCELAWTSFHGTCRKYTHRWCGAFKDDPTERGNYHPTQKPKKLFELLIKKYSKFGTIIDPLAGSGTTGLACMNLNRKCILIEKELDYCNIIVERLKHKEAELKHEFYLPEIENGLFKNIV